MLGRLVFSAALAVLVSTAIAFGDEPKDGKRHVFDLSDLIVSEDATDPFAPEKVGHLGDIDRIEFVGSTAFTPQQLKTGAWQDLDLIVAGRSDAPLSLWLQTLEERMVSGFQSDGYAKVQVHARHDEARGVVVVQIDEGPLYRCGAIEITGAKTLPVDQFREQLTVWRIERSKAGKTSAPISPYLPTKSSEHVRPLWTGGEPADCADEYWRTRASSFRSIFASLGYFVPKFTVRARAEEDHSATLIVTIEDEGPHSTLDNFEIVGLQKNSPEDVIRLLDLPIGTPLNLDVKARIERTLWDSARFDKYFVEIVAPEPGDEVQDTTVKITLAEFEEAKLLSEELTAEETAWLKLFHWLQTINDWEEDIVLEMTMPLDDKDHDPDLPLPDGTQVGTLRAVLSQADKALFVSLEVRELPDNVLVANTLLMTPERFVIDAVPQQLRYECAGFKLHLLGNVDWKSFPPDRDGHTQKLMFGVGYSSFKDKRVSPIQVRATLPPVLAYREFLKSKPPLQLTDDLATIDGGEGLNFSFVRATGVLHELSLEPEPHGRMTVSCRPGVCAELIAEHERRMQGARRITPGKRPVSSFVEFAIKCLPAQQVGSAAPNHRLVSLGNRFLKYETLRAADDLLNLVYEYYDEDVVFRIPHDGSSELVRVHPMWSGWILPICRNVLPKSEWAQVVTREYVLAESMKSYHTTKSMTDFMLAEKIGPVAHFLTSYAFQFSDREVQRRTAKLGLEKLTRDDFRADCDLFLNDKWPLGRMMLAGIAALQDSNNDEIDALCELVLPDRAGRTVINAFLKTLPANKTQSPGEALRALFDAAWEPLMKDQLADSLKKLSE
jgi:hypothetical protein